MKLYLTGQPMSSVEGHWIYLGHDFAEQARLADRMGEGRRLCLARRREAASAEISQRFVEWVSDQGKQAGYSLAWWMSHQAGRNVIASPLFADLCNLHALADILQETKSGVVSIVCDDWFQLRTVERNLAHRGVRCARTGRWWLRFIRDVPAAAARWLARWVKGGGNILSLLAAAKASRPRTSREPASHDAGPCVLMLTCVDEFCLGADGEFRDRYFPGLREWCESTGQPVRTIPWLHNIRRPRREAFAWFRSRPERYLLLEDYMRWWDILPAACTVLGGLALWRRVARFRDWDLRPLLERERLNDSSAAGRLRYLLYIPAIRRWLGQSSGCSVYIQMFENLPDERPALHAFRRYAPDVPTVGYQHIGGISCEALNYSVTKEEWDSGGMPRFVVANSGTTASQLVKQGFPASAVRLGPALRYRYLKAKIEAPGEDLRNSLLVLLPLDTHGAAELLETVAHYGTELRGLGLHTRVKAHPMCPEGALLRATRRSSWPGDWQWVGGSVQEHFAISAAMIGHGSSLLDAAACAIPFLSLRRNNGLTLNPLDAWTNEFSFCKNVGRGDFLTKLTELLSEPQSVRRQRVELAQRIRADLGPCDDRHWRAFLPLQSMRA